MPKRRRTTPTIDAQLRALEETNLASWDRADVSRETKAARRLARRVAKRRFQRFTAHERAVDQLRPLPGPRESIHGAIPGTFSGWSLATAVVELLAEPVDELILSTLGFNRPNCEALCELLDAGTVRALLLNVSNFFRHSDRDIFRDVRRDLEQRGARIMVTRSHAKLMLFRTARASIVVETSANLRSCNNWEQFVVSNDAALFDFHRAWITGLEEDQRELLERRAEVA